jgi:ATP-binding cassette subfamily B protein
VSVIRAGRFLFGLGLEVGRGKLLRAVLLMFTGYVAGPVAALVLGRLTNALIGRQASLALTLGLVAAVLLVAQLMLSHFAHMDYFDVAEVAEARLRGELIDLVNGPPRIEHLDSPAFADTVSLVRDWLFGTTKSLEAVLQLVGLVLQVAITVAILVGLDPWLGLLPLVAIAPVILERRAEIIVERAREASAEPVRFNRHLLELATQADSVKELRLFGTEDTLLARQGAGWGRVTETMWRGQLRAALLRAGGQALFALGYGGAILLELSRAASGQASAGDLVLVIVLAVQVAVQVSGALGLLSMLQAASRTVERIESLRAATSAATSPPSASARPDTNPPAASGRPGAPVTADGAAEPGPGADRAAVPDRLTTGIRLDRVSFAYPGGGSEVLSDVSLAVPAGATLALVGENGAGKSTLVKLLCGLYLPTSGRVLVDGLDLAALDPVAWRSHLGTLFQDFTRIQFTLQESVGLGDVPRVGDRSAVLGAMADAHAERVLRVVAGGLSGYVGREYEHGAELSGGQWQTVGLARTLMRTAPLLLILDEPAAALDASAEHSLFERYATSAGRASREVGGVTVLISHRFSTVLMADLIAVLDHGRLVEFGSHRELMAAGGLYAELFQLQARAYA